MPEAEADEQTCYDLIHLRLGPVPELCTAQSNPQVFQPRRVVRRDASRDLVPPHASTCLHALARECMAPEGPCTSLAYIPWSQFDISVLPCTQRQTSLVINITAVKTLSCSTSACHCPPLSNHLLRCHALQHALHP